MGTASKLYKEQAAAASFTGDPIPLEGAKDYAGSFQAQVGAITGAWKVEVSNDPRLYNDPPDIASARWVDITSLVDFSLAPNPGGVAYDGIIPLEGLGVAWMRLSYTHVAGAGLLKVWYCGREG